MSKYFPGEILLKIEDNVNVQKRRDALWNKNTESAHFRQYLKLDMPEIVVNSKNGNEV